MINKTLGWTAFFSALFTVLSLKFLHLFNFISWSPVGWAKKRCYLHRLILLSIGCFFF